MMGGLIVFRRCPTGRLLELAFQGEAGFIMSCIDTYMSEYLFQYRPCNLLRQLQLSALAWIGCTGTPLY